MEENMRCPKCGYDNKNDAVFCNLCQSPFGKKTVTEPDGRLQTHSIPEDKLDMSSPVVIILLVMLAIMIIGGLPVFVIANRDYMPIDWQKVLLHSMLITIPFAVVLHVSVLFGYAFPKLCDMDKARNQVYGLIGIISFTAVLAGFGIVAIVNGRADRSEPVTHEMEILERRGVNNKGYIVMESWRSGRATERYSPGRRLLIRIKAGRDIAVITTRSGKLGYEWVSEFRIAKKKG